MTIVAKNAISEIERVSLLVADFCARHGLSADIEGDLSLALEEVLANVILHGFDDSAEHEIVVKLSMEHGSVSITVEDEGLPFNPLNAPEPDLTSPIEERPVGGLGVYLVRNIMDELDYQRREGRNCLFMKKHVRPGGD